MSCRWWKSSSILRDPVASIQEIVSSLSPNYIFIATQLIPKAGIDPSWWYLQLDTGQHIGFFTLRALQLLASKSGYQLVNWSHGLYNV